MQEAIVLDHVSKAFGNTVAVDDVSLTVYKGEFLAILGPSGCGKTTTLRLIAGFEQPDAGRIYIMGKDVTNLPVHKRNIGMVFQSYALFPHLSVFDNIAFGLREHGVSKKSIAKQVNCVLELVKLLGFEKRRVQLLSGGEQQRVALARALVVEPLVMLMDEPLGALDRKLREEMQLELKEMLTRLQLSSISVTHDQEEALTMADRVAVMNRGRIEQVAGPEKIYENPDSHFCASFLGLSNIFNGALFQAEAGTCLRISSGLILECPSLPTDGKPSAVMIRPEKVIFSPIKEKVDRNCFKGKIYNLRYLGAQIEYHICLESGDDLVARLLTSDGLPSMRIGQTVYVQLPVSSIHWLQ